MSRRKVYKLSAVAVVLGVVGFAWGRGTGDFPAQPTEFSDLWQWDLTKVPPPAEPAKLRLVLRTHHIPPAEMAPAAMATPLRYCQGEDRVLVADSIADGLPDDGRLTLQLLDVRQLGLAVVEGESPLRFTGVMRMYGSRTKVSAKLNGHSVRGRPVVHGGGWLDGERPLLSFTTAGTAGHDEYTILLSTRPGFE